MRDMDPAAVCLIPCAAHVPPCCKGVDECWGARRVSCSNSCSNSSETRKKFKRNAQEYDIPGTTCVCHALGCPKNCPRVTKIRPRESKITPRSIGIAQESLKEHARRAKSDQEARKSVTRSAQERQGGPKSRPGKPRLLAVASKISDLKQALGPL